VFEAFSAGYYQGEMVVEQFEEGPAIERELYEYICDRLYHKTETDVMMQLSLSCGPKFCPKAKNAMPTEVLGLPKQMFDAAKDLGAGDKTSVYIVRPLYAEMFSLEVESW